MAVELNGGLENFRDDLKEWAEIVSAMKPPKGGNEEAEFRNALAESVLKMKKFDKLTYQINTVFEKMSDEIENDKNWTEEAVQKRWKEIEKKTKLENPTTSKWFDQLAKKIKSEVCVEEEDVAEEGMEVMQVQFSRIDPISKKNILKPVKTKSCQHVYDYDTLVEFAGIRKLISCAVQGCPAKIRISKLEEYPEFFNHIADN